jgi:hypothetical protein
MGSQPSAVNEAQANPAAPGPLEASSAASDKTEAKPAAAASSTEAAAGQPSPIPAVPSPPAPAAAHARDEDPRQIPRWIDEPLPATGLPRFVVRQGAVGNQQFSSLNEAFRQLPPEGGIIELSGNGPFPVRPVQLTQQSVSIRALPGFRPLIVLVPPATGTAAALLQISGGLLELEQVDLAADARQFATSDPLTLLLATAGDLVLKNCSLTLQGTRPGRTTAIRLEGRSKSSRNRLLIDQAAVRGENCLGMHFEVERLDAVIRNSLFATGAAPVLDLRGPFSDSESAVRTIRALSSTFSTKSQAFQLTAGSETPVATSLFLMNSLVAAEPGEPRPPLLVLEDWPQNAIRTNESGPFKNLKWQTEATACLGWKPLIDLKRDELLKVETAQQWQRLWKHLYSEEAFFDENWPKTAVAHPAEVPLKTWARTTLEGVTWKTSEGDPPGCSVASLTAPDLGLLMPALAQAYRPLPPLPFATTHTVPIDLTKQDLGKVLASQDWPDATLFVASGFGNRQSSPLTINGKLIRILFEQTPGAPLTLSPRWQEGSRPPGPKETDDAFITLRGGRLELVNGTFQFPQQERQWTPSWFLRVAGGDFALLNCRVQAPYLGESRNRGLIHWTIGEARARGAASGEYRNYGMIADSFLSGSGELIAAGLNRQAMLLRNSLLVSRDEVFALSPVGEAATPGAAVDAEHCTFSSGGTYFKIGGESAAAAPRLRIYVSECLYAPHFRENSRPQGAVLMTVPPAALEHKQVEWWEDRCGYALDITGFLQHAPEARGGDKQDFNTAWKGQWGGSQVLRPLTGDGGVFLKDPLPQRLPLKPVHFELHGKSKAFTWGDGGEPIGANVASLELSPLAPAPKTLKGPPPRKPGLGAPSF